MKKKRKQMVIYRNKGKKRDKQKARKLERINNNTVMGDEEKKI